MKKLKAAGKPSFHMFEQINEPVEVVTAFRASQAVPSKFLWQGREVLIKKVNLAWSHWEGRSKIYYFAVSDGVNYFKLRFDSDKLKWILLESYTD